MPHSKRTKNIQPFNRSKRTKKRSTVHLPPKGRTGPKIFLKKVRYDHIYTFMCFISDTE